MGLEIRPTAQTLILNYVITLGILGGIVFLSQGKPGAYYYSPAYNDHMGEGYDELACVACHTEPFRAILKTDCTNSQCHQEYMPEYNGWRSKKVYEPGWVSIRAEDAQHFVKARSQFASVSYHHNNIVATMNCTECHTTHSPPPGGILTFDHRQGSLYIPEGVSVAHCTNCHGYQEAPPIRAHEAMLNANTGDCWDCHLSSNSWVEKVEWNGGPAGANLDAARMPIGEATPMWEDINPFARDQETVHAAPATTPTPAPSPTPLPTATPLPTPLPIQVDWRALWQDYQPGMQLARRDKPVMLMFVNRSSSSSNRFEVWFERAQWALLFAQQNLTPVRVDMNKFPETAQQYQVITAPTLVLLGPTGDVRAQRIFAERASDEELLSFMRGE